MRNSPSRADTILRWVARFWSLPAILFVLAEILSPHGGDEAVPFMELLSVAFLIAAVAGLAVAWRWEILGSGLTFFALICMTLIVLVTRETVLWDIGLILLAFIVAPAALFLACGVRARRQSSSTEAAARS